MTRASCSSWPSSPRRHGWDGVFLEDYVFYQGDPARPTCNTWTALAAMAVRTSRVILGVEVVALTRRRPWNVAREAAAVDQLSEGRLVLGVGIGDQGDPGYTHFGEETDARIRAAHPRRGARDRRRPLDAASPSRSAAQHFTIEEVTFRPPSRSSEPRPPIWIGGGYPNPRAIERALRWDGTCMYRRAGGPLLGRGRSRPARTVPASAGGTSPSAAGNGATTWTRSSSTVAPSPRRARDWWVEWVAPAAQEAMRTAVRRGPLRVDS